MKVFLDSIGCRLNQSEIEKIASHFIARGYEITANAADADLVVVNTCAVTSSASVDSRKKIRAAARAGKAVIAATGCYATIDPDAVGALPAVKFLISNDSKDDLVSIVTSSKNPDSSGIFPRQPLPGIHRRTRAFIKVQDGCDNFCTFCVTRIARGKSRSQSETEIYQDVHMAMEGGAKEIVLSGVNLGAWGREQKPQRTLASLIRNLVSEFSPPRLRLSSLEPWDINEEFLLIQKLPGFCPHLHLPLQSGSERILQKMGRRISAEDYLSLVEKLRQLQPEIAITTDMIVGFPGESEADFLASLEFVRRVQFAGGHVFNFSSRPGTLAENLPEAVSPQIKKERSAAMREVISKSAADFRSRFIGRKSSVLWEKSTRSDGCWQLTGLSDNYIRVWGRSRHDLYNTISQVIITKAGKLCLIAEEINEN